MIKGENNVKKRLFVLLLLIVIISTSLISCNDGSSVNNHGGNSQTNENQHAHSYTEQNTASTYLKSKATCTHPAVYYYSCQCGAKGSASFESGLKKDHKIVIDVAIAATCLSSGLTEGSHCSACGETLIAQTTVDVLGHTDIVDPAVAPTCTETGLTEGKHCSACGETLIAQTTVDALGHTDIVDPAVAPTCTETGLTEGKHCSVCGETLIAQTTVDVLGHNFKDKVCTECYAPQPAIQSYDISLGKDSSLMAYIYEISADFYELNIVGIGEMVYSYRPWGAYADDIQRIVIQEGVTVIGVNAFEDFIRLTEIFIPKSVVRIDKRAFYNCDNLKRVNIDSIESWCKIDFANTSSNPLSYGNATLYLEGMQMTDIVIPSSVTTLAPYAFYNYKALKSVSFSKGVDGIGYNAFDSCTQLTSVSLGTISWIGEYAFSNCSMLNSIRIPTSINQIYSYAFQGCSSLSNVYLGYQGTWYFAVYGTTQGYSVSYYWGVDISNSSDVASYIKGTLAAGKWFYNKK